MMFGRAQMLCEHEIMKQRRINQSLDVDLFLFNLKFRAHLLFKLEDAVWFFRGVQKKANIGLQIFGERCKLFGMMLFASSFPH